MTLIEQLDAEADKAFMKLKYYVPAISCSVLLAVLQELANNASSVTMQRYLDRSPDLKDEKKMEDANEYLREVKEIRKEQGHVE